MNSTHLLDLPNLTAQIREVPNGQIIRLITVLRSGLVLDDGEEEDNLATLAETKAFVDALRAVFPVSTTEGQALTVERDSLKSQVARLESTVKAKQADVEALQATVRRSDQSLSLQTSKLDAVYTLVSGARSILGG